MQDPKELVIEIDDRVELLLKEINSAPPGHAVDIAQSLRGVVIDSILGPFGLSATMFDDRDGGNITTVHNFEKGVTANDSDAARHEAYVKAQSEAFDRKDYEAPLPGERKTAFKQAGSVENHYTHADMAKDGNAVRDHVVSAHEIETSAKGQLGQTREERVATANKDDNKVWTDRSLNSSKGDADLKEWANRPNAQDPSRTNAEFYRADPERINEAYGRARKAVDREQNLAVMKKQAREFALQGGIEAGKLAFRQVLGVLLKELTEGVIHDIKTLIHDGFQSLKQLAEMLRLRIEQSIASFKERWADYLKEGAMAGLTGFLSSLATLLINTLITTAKHVVTIIREGTLAVVKSIKLIITPDPGMTASDVGFEVLRLLAGALTTAVGLATQEALAKGLMSVPLLTPFANEIAGVATALLSGTAGLLVVLAFDHVKQAVAFRRKQHADIHRGHAVTLLKIQRTTLMIAAAHEYVAATHDRLQLTLANDWAEIEEAGAVSDAAIDNYGSAAAALDYLLP